MYNIEKKNFAVRATVEDVFFKTCSATSGLLLIAVLMLHFDGVSQKVWDNMIIDHPNFYACKIGRERASTLAVACGYDKRPDDPSVLAGAEVNVKGAIDEYGKIQIYGYEKI